MTIYKPKPRGSVIAALDVGSSKIACFIGRVVDENGAFEVLGVGHRPSQGVKSGVVVDLDQAEESIRHAVHAAEKMAAPEVKGYPLREVITNVSGVHIRSEGHGVDVQINGHDITDNDVLRALAHAQERAAGPDTELIHTIPTFFRVDGHDGIRDPRGMYAEDMHVEIHLVAGDRGALRNLATSIERSHLDVTACCMSAYASGLASLVDDEMDLGCTVIDIGAGLTSFAVFHGGYMIHCDAIPVGGKHVTSDIARVLVTSVTDAERLKILYGSAIASHTDESDMIDVPVLGENERSKPNLVPRALLIGIIQPRFEEIFEIIRQKLTDTGLGKIIGRRVVITGGASQTPGLRELAQHVLDKQVRLGRPIRLSGLPDAVSGPAFSTAAGLLTYASEHTGEMPAEIMARVRPESFVQRAKIWLRENW